MDGEGQEKGAGLKARRYKSKTQAKSAEEAAGGDYAAKVHDEGDIGQAGNCYAAEAPETVV
jgi:hypothetical protein